MSAQEDLDTIQPWRQANRFTLTFRGHWQGIPEPTDTVLLSGYDPYAIDDVSPLIREIASDGNYNTFYESFYAPMDFQLTGLAFKLPLFLPETVSYRVSVRINGSKIEDVLIPAEDDHNQKSYSLDCSTVIYEDDYIELEVKFNGPVDDLSFNEHNMVFSVGGCAWYGMYKSIYSDISVTVATTEDITLSGTQVIDGFTVSTIDFVLVKNQTMSAENGIYIVNSWGAWNRHGSYPTVASLYGVIINVLYGDTQNSIDTTNYVFESGGADAADIPLIEWTEGDKWYKGNVHLQMRSGNETLSDRVVLDSVKATHNFLFQGISVSVFEDPLMVVKKIKNRNYCLYLDLLVNGRSILGYVNFPRPLLIDADNNPFQEFDMDVFNDAEGYPIRFGDVIELKLYQKNAYARVNGLIIQSVLYGCGPDCATLDGPLVSVYEPCSDEPCEWKYEITDKCDPKQAKDARKNPKIKTASPSLPTDIEYITVDGIYVTINGIRTWL